MHFTATSKDGNTLFSPFKETIESMTPKERNLWEQLYYHNSRDDKLTHPVIYPHPVTGDPAMIIHTDPSYCIGLVKNYDSRFGTAEKFYTEKETDELLRAIEEKFAD